MNLKFSLFMVLIGLATPNLLAQNLMPDSLKNVATSDKIIYLNNAAMQQEDAQIASDFYAEAIRLAKTCECDSLLMFSQFNNANQLVNTGFYNKGINASAPLENKLKTSPSYYFSYRLETMKGYAYSMIDKNELSFAHYDNALKIAVKMKDSVRIASSYNNIGSNYININPQKAKEYYKKALNLYLRFDAPNQEMQTVYQNLATVSSSKDSIAYFIDQAFSFLDTTNKTDVVHFYINKTYALISKEFAEESKAPALLAYKNAQQINYKIAEGQALLMLGITELELNNLASAINYLERAEKIEELTLGNKKDVLQYLANAYTRANNLDSSVATYEKLLALSDSIYQQQKTDAFAKFDAQFNLAEKDKEIAQQQLEILKQKSVHRQWAFVSFGIILLIIFIAQRYYHRQKRKKAAVQLDLQKEQEFNQLRTKFLENIAHEIRTPLTLVSGNIQLALENLSDQQKAATNLETALKNAHQISEDANEILELLKFEKQKQQRNESTILLKNTLERVVFSFESMAQIKNISLQFNSVIPEKIAINTDVKKLEKIINNLISNAIKYSPTGGQIVIEDTFNGNILSLSVADQGEGISTTDQEKIFNRFYQTAHASKQGGMGIGLALSKEFAELLGGNIRVKSNLGSGSTFTLNLPVHIADEPNQKKPNETAEKVEPATSPIPPANLENPESLPQILIVEDNIQMADYIKEALQNTCKCTLAFTAVEALKLLETKRFDLITSDIMMPRMDGFQFREKVNMLPEYKNIPFIFISAKTLEADKIKGFSLGIADYIIKPFNKNELIARIKNLLKNKQSRAEWLMQNQSNASANESADKKLLEKIENFTLKNLDNSDFKITDLASHIGYSQRQLARLMKQYTGLSPVKFVLEIRLQKAYALLQNKSYFTLSEVRYQVGISSSAYFNKKFKERYGIMPAELL